jgi:hypothetical protein
MRVIPVSAIIRKTHEFMLVQLRLYVPGFSELVWQMIIVKLRLFPTTLLPTLAGPVQRWTDMSFSTSK